MVNAVKLSMDCHAALAMTQRGIARDGKVLGSFLTHGCVSAVAQSP